MKNNDALYVTRKYLVMTRRDLVNDVARPENVLLQLDPVVKPKPVDIGSWCFLQRMVRRQGWSTGKGIEPLPVVMGSFEPRRRKLVSGYLDWVSVSGLSDNTIFSYTKDMTHAIDWLDSNSCSDFINSEKEAGLCYRSYSDSLIQKMHRGDANPATLSRRQRAILMLIGFVFPDAIPKIKNSCFVIKESNSSKSSPDDSDVLAYLNYLIPFMDGLRRSLMHDDFPFRIKKGACDVSVYPCNSYTIRNHAVQSDNEFHSIYNLHLGEIVSQEKYVAIMVASKNYSSTFTLRRDYDRAIEAFNASNMDKKGSFHRRIYAQKVIRCYASLIQIITGMNPAQLVGLLASQAIEVSKGSVKKELLTIKNRARGRVELYSIGGVKGLKILKDYLEFREWYLDGRKTDLLFFSDIESSGKLSEIVPLRGDFQSRLYKQLKGRVFPEFVKNISPSDARKFKSISLKNLGVEDADVASMLNHSVAVNLKHYNSPSDKESKEQLFKYWSSVRKSVERIRIKKAGISSNDGDIPSGHCGEFGRPQVDGDARSVKPECHIQYGCLYCKRYAFHADEEDIKKLLSMKYVIDTVRDIADDIHAADAMFKDISVRIEAIIAKASDEYPEVKEIAKRVRKEVFELGVLTPFWESRIARYENMGMVI